MNWTLDNRTPGRRVSHGLAVLIFAALLGGCGTDSSEPRAAVPGSSAPDPAAAPAARSTSGFISDASLRAAQNAADSLGSAAAREARRIDNALRTQSGAADAETLERAKQQTSAILKAAEEANGAGS